MFRHLEKENAGKLLAAAGADMPQEGPGVFRQRFARAPTTAFGNIVDRDPVPLGGQQLGKMAVASAEVDVRLVLIEEGRKDLEAFLSIERRESHLVR